MIASHRQDGMLVLTLDRPGKANALTAEMLRDLTTALDRAAADEDVRAVILTGAGRVFSAGADLDTVRDGLATSPLWERLSARMASMPCLTVAALNGTVAGGAFGMVLACDLRIAVPEARFFYPVMRLGFLPQPSDPGRMSALIGPSRTAMILMAGQKIDAGEALAWGLIDRIATPDLLQAQAQALAADACAAPADLVMGIKQMLRGGR